MSHTDRDGAIPDLEALTAILKDLAPKGIELYEFRYYPEAFGSLELVVGKGHECVKFTWDGRDSTLSVSLAEATNKDAIVPWTREADISLPKGEGLFAEIAAQSRRLLMFDTARLKEIHHHSAGNRLMIQSATLCGCFHCEAIFPADEIALWSDDPEGGLTGNTAICPRCSVDAVLPDNIPGAELSPSLLAAMHQHFF